MWQRPPSPPPSTVAGTTRPSRTCSGPGKTHPTRDTWRTPATRPGTRGINRQSGDMYQALPARPGDLQRVRPNRHEKRGGHPPPVPGPAAAWPTRPRDTWRVPCPPVPGHVVDTARPSMDLRRPGPPPALGHVAVSAANPVTSKWCLPRVHGRADTRRRTPGGRSPSLILGRALQTPAACPEDPKQTRPARPRNHGGRLPTRPGICGGHDPPILGRVAGHCPPSPGICGGYRTPVLGRVVVNHRPPSLPVLGHVAGTVLPVPRPAACPDRQSRDAWRTPARPSRTHSGPSPPVPGRVADNLPARPWTHGGLGLPVLGRKANASPPNRDPRRAQPRRPRTRGGRHPASLWDTHRAPGPALPSRDVWRTPAHPSRDPWWTPACPVPGSRGGHLPALPGTRGGSGALHQGARADACPPAPGPAASPARPVSGPVADACPPIPGTCRGIAWARPALPCMAAGPALLSRDAWQTPARPSRYMRRARLGRMADACQPVPGPAAGLI
ncbi:basic proline-rich protein-like [Macrobrachium nipponense]|uniref:basic proline-rich protein-like n=1 Tax=Macrobrachium nipponense TaxID=159736 RepID=UPI0030C7ACD6